METTRQPPSGPTVGLLHHSIRLVWIFADLDPSVFQSKSRPLGSSLKPSIVTRTVSTSSSGRKGVTLWSRFVFSRPSCFLPIPESKLKPLYARPRRNTPSTGWPTSSPTRTPTTALSSSVDCSHSPPSLAFRSSALLGSLGCSLQFPRTTHVSVRRQRNLRVLRLPAVHH
jgi:hypothetical protein